MATIAARRGVARPRPMAGNGPYVLALLPAAGLVALFFLGPALWAVYASFTNMALVGADAANPHFVGLANYQQLFRDPDFFTVLRNSVAFVVGSAVIGQFVLGLLLALLLDHAQQRGFKGGNLVYAAVLLAWAGLISLLPPSRQDFPLGDDFAFARGAMRQARHARDR